MGSPVFFVFVSLLLFLNIKNTYKTELFFPEKEILAPKQKIKLYSHICFTWAAIEVIGRGSGTGYIRRGQRHREWICLQTQGYFAQGL